MAYRTALVLLCLVIAGAVRAQQPTGSPLVPGPAVNPDAAAPELQDGRIFCAQEVTYQLATPENVAEPFRGFIGVWSDAAWDANTCAALIVENVQTDGTAKITYVFGPNGSSSHAKGGILHGTGIIRDGELRFQNSDGTQFAFRPLLADLDGHMTAPDGKAFESVFKRTL
jgi:hypothetical protein